IILSPVGGGQVGDLARVMSYSGDDPSDPDGIVVKTSQGKTTLTAQQAGQFLLLHEDYDMPSTVLGPNPKTKLYGSFRFKKGPPKGDQSAASTPRESATTQVLAELLAEQSEGNDDLLPAILTGAMKKDYDLKIKLKKSKKSKGEGETHYVPIPGMTDGEWND